MNTQIPELAMKVIEVLRRDVPKPKDLPIASIYGDSLRWKKASIYSNLRWKKMENEFLITQFLDYCPMGLHPKARSNTPVFSSTFPIDNLTSPEIEAFAIWWDAQTNAQAAVDAVWGS